MTQPPPVPEALEAEADRTGRESAALFAARRYAASVYEKRSTCLSTVIDDAVTDFLAGYSAAFASAPAASLKTEEMSLAGAPAASTPSECPECQVYARYAENFGDLSNCYDAQDVVNVMQRALDEWQPPTQNSVESKAPVSKEQSPSTHPSAEADDEAKAREILACLTDINEHAGYQFTQPLMNARAAITAALSRARREAVASVLPPQKNDKVDNLIEAARWACGLDAHAGCTCALCKALAALSPARTQPKRSPQNGQG